ncbi:LysR family transcriptional regulator [Hoeflea ulvae]|uniref:LysR family transcriptional regulator n=1 Tax=Hoeflea ulvae TaxID=2983764 RepID=A0ABT3YD59_9HYPH|nr:LysR family transcriptional regulator [Hoeflea ulvae]MCY0093816.1 LysR family transcriptional regulator [Hoeflea ulvae]
MNDMPRLGGEISPRRLQIFWAVAHVGSMTKAAKMLGVTQPSLSQQLSSLEASVGYPLFERRSNAMHLTELGITLLPKAEHVLRSLQELEDEVAQGSGAPRHTVRIAGATSAMRTIVPPALLAIGRSLPNLDFDLHEGSPGEALDLLYARRVNLGILAAAAAMELSAGFQQTTIHEDPYVLIVPDEIDLGDVGDPVRELSPGNLHLLNSTVQFVYGTQHTRLIQDWYDAVLPNNRVTARARSFELAIEMVRHRLGVCVAPALSVAGNGGSKGLRVYHTGLEARRVAAIYPSQYRRQEPYAQLIDQLESAGSRIELPACEPIPPFVAAVTGHRRT